MAFDRPDPRHLNLRILATSDLHGDLGSPDAPGGLPRLAAKIREMRQAADNSLLFDNGDFLQGNPLCDLAASGAVGPLSSNPAILAMNALDYDAMGLGNHEFDYGLGFLDAALSGAKAPILCSNATMEHAPWQKDLLLERNMVDTTGATHQLRIGVFSLLPPQVARWSRAQLAQRLSVAPFGTTAQACVNALRNRGADLVIALCHAGDIPFGIGGNDETLASEIFEVDGLDVVVCGHTHKVSPPIGEKNLIKQDQHQDTSEPSAIAHVLPGERGRVLGCIDLSLSREEGRWQWHEATAQNIEIAKDLNSDARMSAICAPLVQRASASLDGVIGTCDHAISSFFSVVRCDATIQIAALAKYRLAQPWLSAHGHGDKAILVAANPYNNGHDGPKQYSHIDPGAVSLRDVFEMYPYHNTTDAFAMSGQQIFDWLEASVSAYQQIKPGQKRQYFWDPKFPVYEFDSIFGLSYEIDLSQPPCFDVRRSAVPNLQSCRVHSVRLESGQPLKADDEVILVTNGFRGGGGGGYPHATDANRIAMPFQNVRDEILNVLKSGLTTQQLPQPPWRFKSFADTSILLSTGHGARDAIPPALAKRLDFIGQTSEGYEEFEFSLAG